MGVSLLHAHPVAADRTGPQTVDQLMRRVANLGATHTGHFQVDCDTYYSQSNAKVKLK